MGSGLLFSRLIMVQGNSVLSPTLLAVYLDDLLTELRLVGLGCQMGGVWVGAADDLILVAPSRTAMNSMI
jgi:hypothetical protein